MWPLEIAFDRAEVETISEEAGRWRLEPLGPARARAGPALGPLLGVGEKRGFDTYFLCMWSWV